MSANSDFAIAPEQGPAWNGRSPALRWGRAAAAAVLLLAAWGAAKVAWERSLAREGTALRYHGAAVESRIGDRLGQGALLGLLGGFRAVVANCIWIAANDAFQRQEWYKVKADVEAVTSLQPRATAFWDIGSWQLAWNASGERLHNLEQPSRARRELEAKQWVDEGRQLLVRGIENNPDRYELWQRLGDLDQERRHDYLAAAADYREATLRPGVPRYVERFVGYDLERGGDFQGAYQWFRGLWDSTPDHTDPQRAWDKIETILRRLEDRLAIPREKRVFPDPKPGQTPPR